MKCFYFGHFACTPLLFLNNSFSVLIKNPSSRSQWEVRPLPPCMGAPLNKTLSKNSFGDKGSVGYSPHHAVGDSKTEKKAQANPCFLTCDLLNLRNGLTCISHTAKTTGNSKHVN